MAYQALLTDLSGVARKYVGTYEDILVTRRLGDFSELKLELDVRESAASEVRVAARALKLYGPTGLIFFGQVWEPLDFDERTVAITARDPFAGLAWRRVREAVTYTTEDAGDIVLARLAAQNAHRDTFLEADDAPDVSVDRTITYDAGKREDEIVQELAGMAGGFFFRVDPLDDTPGKMGTLRILYPDAGTTRQEVRFGYGKDSVDNLVGFRLSHLLPLTRMVIASQDAEGGRLAAASEDSDAIEEYGLFEEELTFTDVDDTALLQATADAGIRPAPPMTLELTPGPAAPLLFTDFDVGDFVRLNIGHGEVAIHQWVRVIEASLRVTKDGDARLASVVVEAIAGATRANQDPARLFRSLLDAQRARLEALERRVQEIGTTPAPPPAEPTPEPGEGGGDEPPDEGGGGGGDPPAAPPEPPEITGLSAEGQNYMDGPNLVRGVLVTIGVDAKGLPATVSIEVGGSVATLGGSGQAFIDKAPGSYTVNATVTTSAGSDSASTGATVPPVTAE